jgi:hypothetical protein
MATSVEPPVLPAGEQLHSAVAERFSLVRGGPFYRIQQRLGATREERVQVAHRALMAVAYTWLPLLILSAAQGLAFGNQVRIPFLRDFAVNIRLLIALPLLVLSEVGIDRRLRTTVNHFLSSGLVTEAALPSFEAVLERILRLRDRWFPEIVMLVIAYLPSLSIHTQELVTGNISSWHLTRTPSGERLSYAGWWFGLISAPCFRFLMLHWVWRIYLWASFLWRVSRVNLALVPTHPDMAAGLGFLSEAQLKFGAIAFAMSSSVAGQLGNVIAYTGATVGGLKYVILAYCVCAVLLLVAPLLLVTPALIVVRKQGLLDYGALATAYTQRFDAKWVHGRPPAGETLLGSADIQSLADFGNSFAIVRDMRTCPIDKRTLVGLILAAALPMAPVLIFGTPADQLVSAVWKLIA